MPDPLLTGDRGPGIAEALDVGPLRVLVRGEGVVGLGESRVRRAYEPPPAGRDRRRIEILLARGAGDALDLPEESRWQEVSPGVLRDSNRLWDALAEGFQAGAPERRIRVAIRPRVGSPNRVDLALHALLRSVVATAAPLDRALLVHGAVMIPPGGGPAWLFVGPSGAGKTTVTKRLRGWTARADDTALLEVPAAGPLLVSGTPFPGKEGNRRSGVPHELGRIVRLEPHAERLALEPLGPADLFAEIVRRTFWYVDGAALQACVADLAAEVAGRVPGFRLASSLHHDILPVAA